MDRHHFVKLVITVGCMISTFIAVFVPALSIHANSIALATNFIWIWVEG